MSGTTIDRSLTAELVADLSATSGTTASIIAPFTGEVLHELPLSSTDDVRDAAAAARVAQAAWRQTSVTVVLKLLALPLLVWAISTAMGLSELEVAVATVAAGLPTGANAFLLARRYAVGTEASGASVLASTLLSVLTLTVLLAVFRG
jgi:hypothetical protein